MADRRESTQLKHEANAIIDGAHLSSGAAFGFALQVEEARLDCLLQRLRHRATKQPDEESVHDSSDLTMVASPRRSSR